MLSGRRARVRNGSETSDWFPVPDGANQGSIGGPTDFSAALGPLLRLLRATKATLLNVLMNSAAAADDLTVTITGNPECIEWAARKVCSVVADWCKNNGLTVSKKTCALFCTPRQCNAKQWPGEKIPCGPILVHPSPRPIRILGVVLDSDGYMTGLADQLVQRHDAALLRLLPVALVLPVWERRQVYEAIAVASMQTS